MSRTAIRQALRFLRRECRHLQGAYHSEDEIPSYADDIEDRLAAYHRMPVNNGWRRWLAESWAEGLDCDEILAMTLYRQSA